MQAYAHEDIGCSLGTGRNLKLLGNGLCPRVEWTITLEQPIGVLTNGSCCDRVHQTVAAEACPTGCDQISIEGLISKEGHDEQRHRRSQRFMHAVGPTMGDEGIRTLQHLQLWNRGGGSEVRRQLWKALPEIRLWPSRCHDQHAFHLCQSLHASPEHMLHYLLAREALQPLDASHRPEGARPQRSGGDRAQGEEDHAPAGSPGNVQLSQQRLVGLRLHVRPAAVPDGLVHDGTDALKGKVAEAPSLRALLWSLGKELIERCHKAHQRREELHRKAMLEDIEAILPDELLPGTLHPRMALPRTLR